MKGSRTGHGHEEGTDLSSDLSCIRMPPQIMQLGHSHSAFTGSLESLAVSTSFVESSHSILYHIN